jgi:phenylacetate-CoA ligase
MFEEKLRAHSAGLQKAYDRMPYAVQNVLTSARGWFLTRNRYSREMYAELRELRSHEHWTPEQMEAYQRTALQEVVDCGRKNVPFYSAYPAIRLEKPEDIARYPVLSRDVVRGNAELFVSRKSVNGSAIRVGTTGTTGASLRVTYTQEVARRNWAFHMRRWAWAGIAPRTPRITFFGSRVIPPERSTPPFWTHNIAERQILASIFHMSESTASEYVNYLRRHRGKVLEGFPSVLAILSDYVLKSGTPIPMRVVFTDGEPLYPFLRDVIERAFDTRVFDLYGNTELAGLAHECEAGKMHAAPDYAYLEVLDENDRAVPPGKEGFLVWTGFVNDTMPLIRYRIGDRGCWDTGAACSCGRAFPVVVPTITRESDLLHCPDGRVFSPRALNQALKGAHALRFCQIIHEQPGRVVVRGVASGASAYEDVMMIHKNLQTILGPRMAVSSMLAEAPIVRAGGKIPLIIQAKSENTHSSWYGGQVHDAAHEIENQYAAR